MGGIQNVGEEEGATPPPRPPLPPRPVGPGGALGLGVASWIPPYPPPLPPPSRAFWIPHPYPPPSPYSG